jgi:hypothetical protein
MERGKLEDRRRWEEGVRQDIGILGIRNWEKFRSEQGGMAKTSKDQGPHQAVELLMIMMKLTCTHFNALFADHPRVIRIKN